MTDTTIIYFTNNKLDPGIDRVCQRQLVKAAAGKPIISVSQKPMTLGENICMGDIGSSWLNLYKQLLRGVEAARTRFVATAEHDVLYTYEHYERAPLRDDTFYYNENCWFLQWGGNHPELNGMFSTYWDVRMALSQLSCNRELLQNSLRERLRLLDKEEWVKRSILFAGEPGVSRIRNAQAWAKSGKPISLMNTIKDFLATEKAETFRTLAPNVDIRHGGNFTGPKRGKNRTYCLPPWGDMRPVISAKLS
jgi:hypothetical protein